MCRVALFQCRFPLMILSQTARTVCWQTHHTTAWNLFYQHGRWRRRLNLIFLNHLCNWNYILVDGFVTTNHPSNGMSNQLTDDDDDDLPEDLLELLSCNDSTVLLQHQRNYFNLRFCEIYHKTFTCTHSIGITSLFNRQRTISHFT